MSDQTALPLPPRRTPGLEDSVLATIRKHPRGITPARLAEIFSGRSTSSQCSRLVAKGLIERRAGNLFPVAVAAPEPRRAAPDEAAPLVRRSDAGIIVGNPEQSPPLFSPAPEAPPVDPPAPSPFIDGGNPLQAWINDNRAAISGADLALLEDIADIMDSDREELVKIDEVKRDLHRAASDLRTLRALFEDVTGPDLVSKAAHALSAVEALEAREEVIREAERVLRTARIIRGNGGLSDLRFIDPRGGEMPLYTVERVELTDKGGGQGTALLSFTGSKAPGWIGQEIGGAVVVIGVAK